jgi:hypothetical protein
MSQHWFAVVAVVLALVAGYSLGRYRPGAGRRDTVTTEADFCRKLSTRQLRFYRESQHVGSEGVFVSDHELSPAQRAGLWRAGEPGPRWRGVVWLIAETNLPMPVEEYLSQGSQGFVRRGGFLLYGDPERIREWCDLAGLP